MAKYFLKKFNIKYSTEKILSSDCIKALLAYKWPGNIRELENTMEHLVVMSDEKIIDKSDLTSEILSGGFDMSRELNFGEKSLKDMIDEFEKMIFTKAVAEAHTSVKVAELLGISQSTAARKMREHLNENPIENT